MLFAIGVGLALIGLFLIGRGVYFSSGVRVDEVAEKAAEGTPYPPTIGGPVRVVAGVVFLMAGVVLIFPSHLTAVIRMLLFVVGMVMCGFVLLSATPMVRMALNNIFGERENKRLSRIVFIVGVILLAISILRFP